MADAAALIAEARSHGDLMQHTPLGRLLLALADALEQREKAARSEADTALEDLGFVPGEPRVGDIWIDPEGNDGWECVGTGGHVAKLRRGSEDVIGPVGGLLRDGWRRSKRNLPEAPRG